MSCETEKVSDKVVRFTYISSNIDVYHLYKQHPNSDPLGYPSYTNLRSPRRVERQEEVESTERSEGVGEDAPDLPLGPYWAKQWWFQLFLEHHILVASWGGWSAHGWTQFSKSLFADPRVLPARWPLLLRESWDSMLLYSNITGIKKHHLELRSFM